MEISSDVYCDNQNQAISLSNAELLVYIQKSKQGDQSSQSFLVSFYQRLILSRVKKFSSLVSRSHYDDLVQEANFGFLKAIQSFDEEKGKFITYAVSYIDGYLKNYIGSCDHFMKFSKKLNSYKKIVWECQMRNEPIFSDEELCLLLHVSLRQLQHIKKESSVTSMSLDQPIGDDDASLHEVIEDKNNFIEKAIDTMDSRNLLLVLKEVLSWKEYFILYHRFLSSDQNQTSKIVRYFYITEAYYRLLADQALEKVKHFMGEDKKNYTRVFQRLVQQYEDLEKLNVLPISPVDILRYLYLRDSLVEMEDFIYYMKYVERHDFSVQDFMNFTGLSKIECLSVMKSLKSKISSKFQDHDAWQRFKNTNLMEKRISIFEQVKRKRVNYTLLESKYSNQNWEDFVFRYGDQLANLSEGDQQLLLRYFSHSSFSSFLVSLELQFNSYLLHLNTSVHLSLDALFTVYNENKHLFCEEQQMFIESHIFSILPKKVFSQKFPRSEQHRNKHYLIYFLEKLYYKIPNLTFKAFDKSQYLEIRDLMKSKKENQKILDLYYGVDGECYSVKEIQKIFHLQNEDQASRILDLAKDEAFHIYIGRMRKSNIDKSIYVPYIKDPRYDFNPETRKILSLYFCDHYSYEEIRQLPEYQSLTPGRLSDIITENMKKIDHYRFGIVDPFFIDSNQLEEFLTLEGKRFTESEMEVIRLKYVQYINNDEIMALKHVDKNFINRTVKRFNMYFSRFLVKDVLITKEDIQYELQLHPSESTITDKERDIVKMAYGLDDSSRVWSQVDIAKELNISIDIVRHSLAKVLENIKLRKINAYRKELCYIQRDKLQAFLKDSSFLLSDEEITIISYLFEFNGYPLKNLKELESILNQSEKTLRRKYQNAIVKIMRYESSELDGVTNFERDIEPNMKYFSKLDQLLLIEYYKNKKTKVEISKNHHFSYDMVLNRFDFIDLHLYHLLHDKDTKKFNFDLVDEAISDPYFPYYGDVNFMKQVFEMYFGTISLQPMSFQEVIQKLHLDITSTTLSKKFYKFLLAVLKYESGMRRLFSDSDIRSYYEEKHSSMSSTHLKVYQDYFDHLSHHEEIFELDSVILTDLFSYHYSNYRFLSTISKEDMICLLKSEKEHMPPSLFHSLLSFYGLRERDLFTKNDYHRLYQILNSLEEKEALKKVLK